MSQRQKRLGTRVGVNISSYCSSFSHSVRTESICENEVERFCEVIPYRISELGFQRSLSLCLMILDHINCVCIHCRFLAEERGNTFADHCPALNASSPICC